MPMYAFIYILLYLFFYLKNSYNHSLIILLLIIFILVYLSFAKSKLYILYLSHTRAGVRAAGRFRGFGRVLSANRSFYGRRERLAGAFGRVFPCVRARGYAPPIFRARPIPGCLPSHSVRRWYRGNRVGGRVPSAE